MNSVPVRNGKPCVFRVVHVSGTIRKVEEEAVRRAQNLIFEAKGGQTAKASNPLENVFGATDRPKRAGPSKADDYNSDTEMGEISDG